MATQIWLLAAFVVLQLVVGLWIARRVRGASDFFVAGRRLPALLVFATFLAANIGAGSTVGAASIGYRLGLGAWWWNASAGLGCLVLAVWAGPRLWQLAHDRGFLTFGDFLEWRYSRSARGAASILLLVGSMPILAGQLLGASTVLQVVLGLPRWVGATAAGAIVLVYFVAGGLLSTAWVNLVQLAVKLTGFALAFWFALRLVGGWSGLQALPDVPSTFTALGGPPGHWLSLLVLLVPAFIVSPGLIQKAYGAESRRAVTIGVAVNGVALLVFAICPAVLGMVARARHPDLTDVNLALPTLLAMDLPPTIGAFTLAGVLAAEISAADAVLFMLSTSTSQDLYRRFFSPGATDTEVVRVARLAAVAAGIAGIGMAIVIPTVVDALQFFYGIITASLFVPVAAALLTRRGGQAEALSAMAAGLVAWVLVRFLAAGSALSLPAPAWGILAAATAFSLVLALRSGP